ncbi:hypothetical protein M595_4115 [Lyngbya aestuarii BL J]|uniref:Uncharacterized protein n=1 Tax=Lyngbya aestuarii BL J TaxID=1348334 RepID=U7QHN8_9CYAN|nr:hypothetical protein M595_4115 [Lyngbya aestuarii BL J]
MVEAVTLFVCVNYLFLAISKPLEMNSYPFYFLGKESLRLKA